MNAQRRGEAAHAPHFHVDDFACVQVQCPACVLIGVDALVEADGRAQLRLQARMVNDVFMVQRLLDEQQLQVIKRLKARHIRKRVRGVGVHLQQQVRELLAHGGCRFHVPAGFDLELDALIALRHKSFDTRQLLFKRGLNAHTYAHGHGRARCTQHLCQRLGLHLPKQVPDGGFNAGACHGMAAHARKTLRCRCGRFKFHTQQRWRKNVAQHMPVGLHRFIGIPRAALGHALAPTGEPTRVCRHQYTLFMRVARKAGFKRR